MGACPAGDADPAFRQRVVSSNLRKIEAIAARAIGAREALEIRAGSGFGAGDVRRTRVIFERERI